MPRKGTSGRVVQLPLTHWLHDVSRESWDRPVKNLDLMQAEPPRARNSAELKLQIEEAIRMEGVTRRMLSGDASAVDEQLQIAQGFDQSFPSLSCSMRDTVVAFLTARAERLDLAERLSRERVEWLRDRKHLLQLARVCRAKGPAGYDEAAALEEEAEITANAHPRYLHEDEM